MPATSLRLRWMWAVSPGSMVLPPRASVTTGSERVRTARSAQVGSMKGPPSSGCTWHGAPLSGAPPLPEEMVELPVAVAPPLPALPAAAAVSEITAPLHAANDAVNEARRSTFLIHRGYSDAGAGAIAACAALPRSPFSVDPARSPGDPLLHEAQTAQEAYRR